jgi:3alpha(or 20beta)-hydroxysteroid dehydrogenase
MAVPFRGERFEGRVAVVTGAARGTGLVTARRFAEEGARVVLADILDEAGTAAAETIAAAGGAAEFHRLDVTDETAWTTLVEAVVGAHGRIDVLVNNAAALFLGSIDDTPTEEFERILRVNVVGPFLGIRAVSPVMRAQRCGSIVNVSSTDGLMAHNGVSAYVSSKFALRGLTKTAAIELGPYGVRVNTVCPSGGSIDMISPYFGNAIDLAAVMTAPRRAAIPDEPDPEKALGTIAEMILFLAGDGAAGCTGGDFPVDRGETAGVRMPGMPGYVPD